MCILFYGVHVTGTLVSTHTNPTNTNPSRHKHKPFSSQENLCCGGRRTIAGWTWVHALDETQGTQEYSKEPDGSFDDKHGLYRIVAPQR